MGSNGFQRRQRANRGKAADVEAAKKQTDIANARRFVRQHGGVVRYVPQWGHWITWSGKVWHRDVDRSCIDALAKKTADRMWSEVGDCPQLERDDFIKHVQRSSQVRSMRDMVTAARSDPAVIVDAATLDADPFLLTCADGTIDLRTGELLAHDPSHLITRMVPHRYEPDAECPTWERFMREVTLGDQSLIDYLQRAGGLTLTGFNDEALFILYGDGSNGKGVFVHTLERVLGPWACGVSPEFLASKFDKDSAKMQLSLAHIYGRRLVTSSETDQGCRLNEALLKAVTGRDIVTAKALYHDQFDYRPTYKIWFSTNHLPEVVGQDYGVWRRARLIPWLAKFTEETKDKYLEDKLAAEIDAIFAWFVRGAIEWRRVGLSEPAAVKAAVEEYQESEDLLGRYIADCFERGEGFEQTAEPCFRSYLDWCRRSAAEPIGSKTFYREMKKRLPQKPRCARATYLGVRLAA